MLRRLGQRGSAAQRVDQPLHRAAVAALPGGCRGGLSRAPAGRQRVAVGHVGRRHGPGGLHQPRRARVVRGQGAGAARLGGGRGQDRLRRADPVDVVWFDGSDPHRMHNYYTLPVQPDRLRRRCEAQRGAGEAVLFARSATVGGQQFPVHWGGDCESTYRRWPSRCAAGCRWGWAGSASGATTSAGSRARRRPALFKRWVAFGLLSSHSRLHGSSSYRVPWAFDEEAVEVTRRSPALKNSLMPYLWAPRVQAHEDGIPVMRAMVLEFPDDRTCALPGPPVHARAGPARRARSSPTRARSRCTCRRAVDELRGRQPRHRAGVGAAAATGSTRCRCWCGRAR